MTFPLPNPVIDDGPIDENLRTIGEAIPRRRVGAFKAYRNAASSLATGALVAFDTTDFDTAGWLDTTTGVWTPRIAGRYPLTAFVTFGATITVDKRLICKIRQNGTVIAGGTISWQRGAADGPRSLCTTVVVANGTTDYFDVIVDHDNGGTVALSVGSSVNTYFASEGA